MEIEKSSSKVANKLWKMVRIVLYMTRKGIANSNILVDLQKALKKGKFASKAILENIMMLRGGGGRGHRCCYSALTCRPDDINASFVSPREYEFSCSNTPVYASRRRRPCQGEEEIKLMNRVLDILHRFEAAEASPLLGFGAGQTSKDRPSAVERHQVDSDAEEFINKFYRDLKNQRLIAAMESPSPYHICAR